MTRVITSSEEETIAAGRELARRLRRGDIVACFGNLGTGKTCLVKGICKGLGVRERVMSPTFTILREYAGDGVTVYHWDFYRVTSEPELRELGFEESLNGDGVCLVEWADRVQSLLPPHRFDVHLKLGNTENSREISIEEIVGVAA